MSDLKEKKTKKPKKDWLNKTNVFTLLIVAFSIIVGIFICVFVLSNIQGSDLIDGDQQAIEENTEVNNEGKPEEVTTNDHVHHDGEPMHGEHHEDGEYTLEEIGHIGGDELLIEDPLENETDINGFYEKINRGDDFYVFFYSPYCPYCHDLVPFAFDLFKDKNVDFISVDVNQKVDFLLEQEIEIVPMIVHFNDGERQAFIEGSQDENSEIWDDFFTNDTTYRLK